MIEKIIVLEDVDPVIFYGINNANMQTIKSLYPKLRIVARDNVIKVMGDAEEMAAFEEHIGQLEAHCASTNQLTEEDIIRVVRGQGPKKRHHNEIIVFSVTANRSRRAVIIKNV